MTIREQLTELIDHLPDDKLHLVWEQLDAVAPVSTKNGRAENGNRTVEFDVPLKPGPFKLPPPQRRITDGQRPKVEMSIGEPSVENQESMRRFSANVDWWNEHGSLLRNDSTLRGKYVAVSEGKIYSAATYDDVRSEVSAEHATDTPYIFFLHVALESMKNAN